MPLSLSAVKRNHFKTKIIILNMNNVATSPVMCVPHILSNHTLTFARSHTDDDNELCIYSRLLVYWPYLKFSLCLDAEMRWAAMSADSRVRVSHKGQVNVFVWRVYINEKKTSIIGISYYESV